MITPALPRITSDGLPDPPGFALIASGAALIIYSLALPLLVGSSLAGTPPGIVLLLLAGYSGVRFAYEIGRGASRWFVLSFYAFTYVFLGIAPLAQLSARYLPWAVETRQDVLFAAAVVCLIGVLSFDAGLWAAGLQVQAAPPVRRRVGSLRTQPREPSVRPGRVFLVLGGFTVVSLALMASRGGLALVFASRDSMHAALCPPQIGGSLAECGVVEAVVRVPSAVLAVTALGLSAFRSRAHWLALALAAVGLLITANPVSAPRFWFGAVAIGIVGVTIGRSAQLRVPIWLLTPLLLIVLFPNLDFGRYQGGSIDLTPRLEAIVEKQDFDAYQQVVNGITYADAFGNRNGMQTLSALLFLVPRSVWSDKAPPTGTLVTAAFGVTNNNNVSAPLWEEGYVDFGVPGVVLVLAAFGFLVQRIELGVQYVGNGGTPLACICPLLAGYGLFLLRGSLLPAVGPLALLLVLTFVATKFGLQRFRSDSTATRPSGMARPSSGEPLHPGP